jgi:multicomponent Na+:H+ antiporter subunit D
VLLVVVFGIKAALFPLFFWLPDAYPTAPAPITAVFAGLLTKVGVYAILRTETLLFPADSRPGTLLVVLAAATMVVGVLGAIAQDDVKRILSFDIVSQIGYIVLGVALFSVGGVAAAVFFIVQHIVIKTTLFLVTGLIEHTGGSGRMTDVGGLLRSAPFLGVLFLLPALSLAGVPPLSGFVAKLAVIDAGFSSREWAAVGVSLAVSLLTLFLRVRSWSGVFWSPAGSDAGTSAVASAGPVGRLGGPTWMVVPTAVLVAGGLAIAAFAGPVWSFSERTAADLLHPARYVDLVTGGGAGGGGGGTSP